MLYFQDFWCTIRLSVNFEYYQIGTQIHNYHSVTGLSSTIQVTIQLTNHSSIGHIFTIGRPDMSGNWMRTVFQILFYFRTRCMKLGSKILLAWKHIAIQNFPKLVSEITSKKTSTPNQNFDTSASWKTSNSALVVLELKWLLFTSIFKYF